MEKDQTFNTAQSEEKYCVPKGGAPVRLASLSGHTVIIDEIPRQIMAGFEQEALEKGCITESEYLRRQQGYSPLHPPADLPEWLQRLPGVFTLEEAAKIMQTKQESRTQAEHKAIESLLVKLFAYYPPSLDKWPKADPVASYLFGKSVSFVRSDDDEEKPIQCNEVVNFRFIGNVRGRMEKQGLKGKIEILPRRGPHNYFDCKILLYVLDNDSPNGIIFVSPCKREVIDEDSLVITRESLWKYAVAADDSGVQKRLETMTGYGRVENHDEQETCEGMLENIGLLSQKKQAEKRKEYIGKCKELGRDIFDIGARLKKSGASASFIRRELDPEYKKGENKGTTATKGGVFVKKCLENFETNNK